MSPSPETAPDDLNPTATNDAVPAPPGGGSSGSLDIADVPAVEVVLTVAMHLMSAAAVACGLGDDEREADLAEARILIGSLAGLVTAAAPMIGSMHAAPLRDGLTALQRAFREASSTPDAPGMGPGEDLTGPVY